MPRLHVCSLSRVPETVRATGARSLVTLINVDTLVSRPAEIDPTRHLFIGMSDISEPLDGHILPAEQHVRQVIDFAKVWDRNEPLVIHCYAGVSRSTAAASIIACALAPSRHESDIADAIRHASHTATPNRRMVAIADAMLGRNGRMVAAIERIGRGSDCCEGVPFVLELA
ncbi:MAG: tyrosine phosphatase family protein [Methylobacteriaceae bacterium]|nr:tyrosine phosphatase family protein [Methylobacteriaceae bacterium]